MANFVNNSRFNETEIGTSDTIKNYLTLNSKNINIAHINTCSINPKKNSSKIDFFNSIPK